MELKSNMSPPIFIIGSPRSGTTMLRLMLSAHSKISIPHEFTLVKNVINTFNTNKIKLEEVLIFINNQYKISHFVDWKLDKENLLNQFTKSSYSKKEIIEIIYNFYLLTWSNGEKNIWGDKNISSVVYIQKIKEIFPNAKFIHIVRDGRDVAKSLLQRRWVFYKFDNKTFYINHFIGAIKTWNEAINIINDNRLSNNNFIEIKYENLIKETEKTLIELCNFLCIEYQSEMLNFYEKEKNEQTISIGRVKDTHENIYKPIINKNIKLYKSFFSVNELKMIEMICGENLLKYNYTLDYENEKPSSIFKLMSKTVYFLKKNMGSILFNLKRVVKKVLYK